MEQHVRSKPGKHLGGKPPRRGGRLSRPHDRRLERRPLSAIVPVLAIGVFIVGGVAGFGWALDRQIRGGILQQRAEAVTRPDWVPLAQLPPHVPRAFLAVVDPDFMQEGALRTGEAGTTLSRELVRQVHLLPAGITGEARELVMAPVLENRTSKESLLELYINRVYLGQAHGEPVFGAYHAAREFLEKEPGELTLGEAATLAGLLLHPRIENPSSKPGAVGVRRNEVLRVMLQKGYISVGEYQNALGEPLGFQPGLGRQPMSRPLDWADEPEVIRLPEEYRPRPDTTTVVGAAVPPRQ
jgi:membrane peptidoglycan carboxypeptidase